MNAKLPVVNVPADTPPNDQPLLFAPLAPTVAIGDRDPAAAKNFQLLGLNSRDYMPKAIGPTHVEQLDEHPPTIVRARPHLVRASGRPSRRIQH